MGGAVVGGRYQQLGVIAQGDVEKGCDLCIAVGAVAEIVGHQWSRRAKGLANGGEIKQGRVGISWRWRVHVVFGLYVRPRVCVGIVKVAKVQLAKVGATHRIISAAL
jgi:hypothetical protein